MNEFVVIGKLRAPFGLKGFIKCTPLTHDMERIFLLKNVFLKGSEQALDIEEALIQNDAWLLKFKDFDDPESLIDLTNQEICVASSERLEAPDGMIYFSDAPGYQVCLEDMSVIGEVIELIDYPSVNAFHIQVSASFTGSKEKKLLVPWVADAVLKVDSQHRMLILYAHFLNGLMEKDPLE